MSPSSELLTAHDNRRRFATSVVPASANLLAEASMMSKGNGAFTHNRKPSTTSAVTVLAKGAV